jgi:hypothetical protein
MGRRDAVKEQATRYPRHRTEPRPANGLRLSLPD